MKNKLIPPEAFTQFFSEVYGSRWPEILLALQQEEIQVPRANSFTPAQAWDGEGEIPRGANGLLSHYVMDPASIEAALCLEVGPEDKVLDMCAAPGGKTLILAEALGATGELIANELSAGRRERLKKVIQQYLPREVRDHVFIAGKDGGKFALQKPKYFDKILVDAPCSGERHLLENSKELEHWTMARSKKLAQRQYALLTAALISAKSRGRIVYSTCSISPLENDGVIQELLDRKSGKFEVEKIVLKPGAEATKYGVQFLPDKKFGGPIFMARLHVN